MKNILTFYVKNVEKKKENLFGKWLGKIIDDSGLKKKTIAERASIYPGSLSRILSGEINASKDTAVALMKAINDLTGKQLCDSNYGLGLIFGLESYTDSDLLRSIHFELQGSEKWAESQKEEFLQLLRILIAGINSKGNQVAEVRGNKEIAKREVFDPKGISQEEWLRSQETETISEQAAEEENRKKRKLG